MSIEIGLYRHFKGAFYRVMEIARHSETEEELVVYQALYGEKGVWVRPLSMFCETVEREGLKRPRFEYIDPQTEVLEVAMLDIKPGLEGQFELAFATAEPIIRSMQGYIRHDLQRGVENPSRYLLLVNWQTLDDHNIGFRESPEYSQWKKLLHHYYDPFPVVEHFQKYS